VVFIEYLDYIQMLLTVPSHDRISPEGACRVIAVLSTPFKDLCQAEADFYTVKRGEHDLNILLFDSDCIVWGL